MDPKTCKYLLINPKMQREPLKLYRAVKYIVDNIVANHQHEILHPWIECLQYIQPQYIIWTEDTFCSLIFLLSSVSDNWCESCITTGLSFFKIEQTQELMKKFLPRLLGQTRPLDAIEWKCLRNYSFYLSIPRLLQRNILTVIRDTFQRMRDRFERANNSNSSTIDASSIFIIECATHILFNIAQIDPDSITSICQQNARSIIQLIMTIKGHSIDIDNTNKDQSKPLEEEETSHLETKDSQLKNKQQKHAFEFWKSTLSSNLSSFVVSCLMNQVIDLLLPNQSPYVGFTLSETFSLFQSSHYSLQLPSLALIFHYLENDLNCLKNLPNTLSSSKSNSSASSSSSSLVPLVSTIKATKKLKKLAKPQKDKQNQAANSQSGSSISSIYHPQAVIEICQNGYLRQLCWCLIHPQSLVRTLALKIMRLFHQIMYYSPKEFNDSIHSALVSLKQVWVISMIEQGLVPVLEWITHGVSIYQKKSLDHQPKAYHLFPEDSIREWSKETLQLMITDLESNPVSLLQNKLYLALIHTNSSKLRCNILCGLYFLSPRSSFLQRWIQCPKQIDDDQELSSPPSSLFRNMLQELSSNESHHQFDHLFDLLKLLLHLLRSSQFINSLFLDHNQSNQTISSLGNSLNYNSSNSPSIYVLDTSSPLSGTLVKIDYPPLRVLAQHSHLLIETILEQQKNSEQCILPGSFEIWQELFSHMSNEYLLAVAMKESNLSIEIIFKLYQMALQYDISPLLKSYTAHLLQRLSKKTVIYFLQHLLLHSSNQMKRSSSHSDLLLLTHSLGILLDSWKGVWNNIRQDARQMILFHEILFELFHLPLL